MDEQQQSEEGKEPESNWQYNTEQNAGFSGGELGHQQPLATLEVSPVEWQASEYIAHEKSANWFFGLAGGSALLVALVYLITQELLPSIVILIAFASVGVYAARKPATKEFKIDSKGVYVEKALHPYKEFRSFSIVEEGAFDSIWLVPLKRFAPIVVMYFSPDDEQKIVDVLANFLPNEQRELDAVDRFTKRMKF